MIQDPHPGMKIRTTKIVGAIPLGAMYGLGDIHKA